MLSKLEVLERAALVCLNEIVENTAPPNTDLKRVSNIEKTEFAAITQSTLSNDT